MSDSVTQFERGLALLSRCLYAEAEVELMKVPANSANFPKALEAASIAVAGLGRHGEGLCMLEYAAKLAPNDAEIHYNLGVTYGELDQNESAMLAYQRCLRNEPDHIDALWNYSELLRTRMHFGLAFELLKRLEHRLPEDRLVAYHHRLGVTLGALREVEASRQAFETAIALSGEDVAVTQWEYSHLLLSIGDWDRGWEAYDYRFAAGHKTNVACHDYPYPLWRGED